MKAKIVKGNIEKILKNKYTGVRFDTCKTKRRIGATVPCSWDWGYEEETGKKRRLDGTCAVNIINDGDFSYFENIEEAEVAIAKAIDTCEGYDYNHIYIISGTGESYGNDDNEVIIENAEVIGIVEIEK